MANLVTVPLSAAGGVSIYNFAGSTDVVVDVEGYYTSTPATNNLGLYTPLSPYRALGSLAAGAPIAANTAVPVTVTGTATGVPGNASAVVVNVTAEGATNPSFLTVYPAGATQPVASNLNFGIQGTNVAIANRATVGVGTNGQIEVYNHTGSVNVDVDVDGYYSGAGGAGSVFVPITPVRLADTRTAPPWEPRRRSPPTPRRSSSSPPPTAGSLPPQPPSRPTSRSSRLTQLATSPSTRHRTRLRRLPLTSTGWRTRPRPSRTSPSRTPPVLAAWSCTPAQVRASTSSLMLSVTSLLLPRPSPD